MQQEGVKRISSETYLGETTELRKCSHATATTAPLSVETPTKQQMGNRRQIDAVSNQLRTNEKDSKCVCSWYASSLSCPPVDYFAAETWPPNRGHRIHHGPVASARDFLEMIHLGIRGVSLECPG